ncbi:MAG: D-alanyl-D-alanine carboxypeptidase, partial [Oscillospiraceae bacterium]|nr:D-alanyl-D-alanine carboxypeptidase [Oscillospiraceae bacterium]
MKKAVAALALLAVCVLACPPVRAVGTHASCAILMDAESGRVLFEQDIHRPRLIASTTKLLTA